MIVGDFSLDVWLLWKKIRKYRPEVLVLKKALTRISITYKGTEKK